MTPEALPIKAVPDRSHVDWPTRRPPNRGKPVVTTAAFGGPRLLCEHPQGAQVRRALATPTRQTDARDHVAREATIPRHHWWMEGGVVCRADPREVGPPWSWCPATSSARQTRLPSTEEDVGTRIILFGPSTDVAFVGPVTSRLPQEDLTGELRAYVVALARSS